MRLLTKRDLILGIVDAWEERFGPEPDRPRFRSVLEQLRALDLTCATEEDLAEIIGNRSWTRLECSECKTDCEAVVQIGDETDPDRGLAHLCPTCLRRVQSRLTEADVAVFEEERCIRC